MGSKSMHDKEATENEKPQQIITLPAYDIFRFPVTVAEYDCFVQQGHRAPQDWQVQMNSPDHPVVNVSYGDAVAYAYWLSRLTKEDWRLPAEAEWEKAARGTGGRIYPWGDIFDSTRCNTSESHIGTTTAVGSYPSGISPYGVQDMAGNVWEWTSSRYLQYPYTMSGEREDPKSDEDQVLRGGSWMGGAKHARAAYRRFNYPDDYDVSSGFRLVRAAPNP